MKLFDFAQLEYREAEHPELACYPGAGFGHSKTAYKSLQEQFIGLNAQAEALDRFRNSGAVKHKLALRSLDKARSSMQNALNALTEGMLAHEENMTLYTARFTAVDPDYGLLWHEIEGGY